MPKALLTLLVLLALLVPAPPATAGPPEGVSGRMVLDNGKGIKAPSARNQVILGMQEGPRPQGEVQRDALRGPARVLLPP